jgi:toxin YoeB
MSKHVDFQERAWNDYMYWHMQDKKTLKKLNLLIRDIIDNGPDGIGKPEPLRGDLSGWWSRRIDDSNRIVYRTDDEKIEISQCRGHYRQR